MSFLSSAVKNKKETVFLAHVSGEPIRRIFKDQELRRPDL
jgi:hypothetical protein